ncbi:cytochrome c [Polynucleobacter sp. 31A-FELB]|uniref:c-type cytochrome n=1 Tax=Polynucleobacter sp. 31A-FELB TaxID=2689096 RepID=UPI001D95DD67|nr:cytochrome c [Polynucleobacter sp. 31A-FELB]MBU3587894.1 cytochrome c [Polynucleobacter sp. 31A-FELB]
MNMQSNAPISTATKMMLALKAFVSVLCFTSFSIAAQTSVKNGEYLATAGDCISCHTAPGGKPFAGGLKMNTPFGYLLSPNITPDFETGIGSWSKEDFLRAMHDGVNKKGQDLYPAMPFTSYTKVSKEDVGAIYDYLRTVTPVSNAIQVNQLDFPFNIRSSMIVWRELFFTRGFFKPNPKQSDAWNRGAYLVEGLEHCSACHSPRNIMGAIKPSKEFTGAVIDGWYALNLTSNPLTGLGNWSAQDIASYLKTGSYPGKTSAFGPMEEVVHNSTQNLTDADLMAMATYLKSLPSNSSLRSDSQKVFANKAQGAALYIDNCSGCHQSSGRGIVGVIPPLDANPAVLAPNGSDIIKVMILGLKARNGYTPMPAFASRLTDDEMATIANYVRTSWGNSAAANVTAAQVKRMRANP